MKLWESSALKISFDEATEIFTQQWTGFATSAQFREGIEKSIELFKKHNAEFLLTDSLTGGVVKKEDTDWAATYAVPLLIQSGMKAQAFVIPTNAFIQLSVKNFGNKAGGGFELQYFDDLEKAKSWLLA